MEFAQIHLSLEAPVHIGAGRSGMVSRSLGFVPGHVVAYAMAAVLGRRLGGKPDHYEEAIAAIRQQLRCGPLFLLDADHDFLFPRRDRERIETRYLTSVNHNVLDGSRRSAVRGGLFEIEAIPVRAVSGRLRAPTRLSGGLWFSTATVCGVEARELLRSCTIGGERNAGLGRVRLESWDLGKTTYAGVGRVESNGKLYMSRGDTLPGPALDGVVGANWQPWLGRLHDRKKGAGRRFSAPVLVRMDGEVENDGCFELVSDESGFGCWRLCNAVA